jgi:hypothetical protein
MHYVQQVHALAKVFEPWQSLYSNSKVLSGAVTFLHIAATMFAGGFAIAADRMTFRALRTPAAGAGSSSRASLLAELHDVHRPVLIGLAVLFVSGLLQATSDIETFGTSVVFWVKMALVALLLANGAVLQRTETALRMQTASVAEESALWTRMRTVAIASVVLWTAIVLAGTVLMSS